MLNVFLVPAHAENLAETIARGVSKDYALNHATDVDSREAITALAGQDLRCWGTTSGSLGEFRRMQKGDWVLLSPNGTGVFRFAGRVSAKLHSRSLGESLWPINHDKPWEYVYFLSDVAVVSVQRESIWDAFGYPSSFLLRGLTRVADARVAAMLKTYGSVRGLIRSLDHE